MLLLLGFSQDIVSLLEKFSGTKVLYSIYLKVKVKYISLNCKYARQYFGMNNSQGLLVWWQNTAFLKN